MKVGALFIVTLINPAEISPLNELNNSFYFVCLSDRYCVAEFLVFAQQVIQFASPFTPTLKNIRVEAGKSI